MKQITPCGIKVDERFAVKLADNGKDGDAFVALYVAPYAADVGSIAPCCYFSDNGGPTLVGFMGGGELVTDGDDGVLDALIEMCGANGGADDHDESDDDRQATAEAWAYGLWLNHCER